MSNNASILLRSGCIFSGERYNPEPGFVAVRDNYILKTGTGTGSEYSDSSTQIFDLPGCLICPGFIDVHCFFTGHAWALAGGDPGGASSDEELLEKAKKYLSDRKFIVPVYKEYMQLLNSRGITSVKEMAFDDFSGFTGVLDDLQKSGEMTLRVHFMSQPSSGFFDLELGKKLYQLYHSDFLFFSGYNLMTDGSISQYQGDLKEPYLGRPDVYCEKKIDYDQIKKGTLAADQEGFRVSLHAQGDGAVAKVLDIYEQCRRREGRLLLRHAITDLELTDREDLLRMGKIGVVAEIYPQIPSLYKRQEKLDNINATIGAERGKRYWNRRAMADNGVVISCGTDLPLLYDDIPESIYHAGGGFFADNEQPFNSGNVLTVEEILRAWTGGGAWNLAFENKIGKLSEGKLADIAVLDGNVFTVPVKATRNVKVCLTILNGRIVYSAL